MSSEFFSRFSYHLLDDRNLDTTGFSNHLNCGRSLCHTLYLFFKLSNQKSLVFFFFSYLTTKKNPSKQKPFLVYLGFNKHLGFIWCMHLVEFVKDKHSMLHQTHRAWFPDNVQVDYFPTCVPQTVPKGHYLLWATLQGAVQGDGAELVGINCLGIDF